MCYSSLKAGDLRLLVLPLAISYASPFRRSEMSLKPISKIKRTHICMSRPKNTYLFRFLENGTLRVKEVYDTVSH